MSQQLAFDLPVRPSLDRGDYFVSPSNAMALALIEDWPNWPQSKHVLYGPTGCGKTHLTHVWAAQSGAQIVSGVELADTDISKLGQAAVAVEDLHLITDHPEAQTALFHLHNIMQSQGAPLLMTGTGRPQVWGITLPDLLSRIQGARTAHLEEPDDQLFLSLLAKLFADRQLVPTPDVLSFLVTRIDRSYEAARSIVRDIDRLALEQKRPITRAFVSRLFINLE